MMKLISEELLDSVSHEARESSRLRMNYNFHESLDSPIHRLLNALEPGTYLPPHRHTDKEETYVVLRGSPEDIAPWAPAPSDLEGAAVFMKRMLEV